MQTQQRLGIDVSAQSRRLLDPWIKDVTYGPRRLARFCFMGGQAGGGW